MTQRMTTVAARPLSKKKDCSNGSEVFGSRTASQGINVAEIKLQDCGSVLFKKRWSRAASLFFFLSLSLCLSVSLFMTMTMTMTTITGSVSPLRAKL